jgi:hypothetical protein
MMAKCGFGKVVTNGVWEASCPFGTDLEGRFLYIEDAGRRWLLAAFDFSYMFRRTSLAWRKGISAATGIPIENIWVHELQNHSAPVALDLDGKPIETLVERSLPVIREMISGAEEAELSYAVVDLGDRHNFNREQYIPGIGMVTVWTGCEFDEEDRPYCQNPGIMLLYGWNPDPSFFKDRIYFDRPNDPQGVLLVVRNRKGKVLGTLSRFSAHADVVGGCLCQPGAPDSNHLHYHFDWPGYLRLAAEEKLGGMGVCVCGPCGNQSTKKRLIPGYQAGDRQARQIAQDVFKELFDGWEKTNSGWQTLSLGRVSSGSIKLPLRETMPHDQNELSKIPEITAKYLQARDAAIQAKEPAFKIKKAIDTHIHWEVVDRIINRWAGLLDEELAGRYINVEVEAVQINDLVLAGLPGESMAEASLWLRAQSLGTKLIALDQVNGYCAYQTTREQYDLGGYSFWCSCLARGAETLSRRKALDMIRDVYRSD